MDTKTIGRAKGGKVRAENLTPERRKEISMRGVAAKKAMASLPRAINSGELPIGEISIPCHVLEGEVRVVSGRGMQNSLGFSKDSSGMALAGVVNAKLLPYLSKEAIDKYSNPIQFVRVGSGGSAPDTYGYDATLLIDFCDALISARDDGVLTKVQLVYAKVAETIIRAVAKVGIIALIDEATGYQRDRQKDALAKILEAFVAKEIQPYLKTFPNEYYENLFRLYGLPYPPKGNSSWRPGFFGKITNDVIYSRLAPEILPELKKLASRAAKKAYLHQCLTKNIGHPKLKEHLASIISLQRISKNPDEWLDYVNRAHPRYGEAPPLPLEYDVE